MYVFCSKWSSICGFPSLRIVEQIFQTNVLKLFTWNAQETVPFYFESNFLHIVYLNLIHDSTPDNPNVELLLRRVFCHLLKCRLYWTHDKLGAYNSIEMNMYWMVHRHTLWWISYNHWIFRQRRFCMKVWLFYSLNPTEIRKKLLKYGILFKCRRPYSKTDNSL